MAKYISKKLFREIKFRILPFKCSLSFKVGIQDKPQDWRYNNKREFNRTHA